MRFSAFALTMTLLCAAFAAHGTAADEAALIEAQAQRFRAQVDRDFATLNRVIAADLAYTHSSGLRQSKSEYLDGLRGGGTVYRRVEAGARRVQIIGTVAVITGDARVSINLRGADSESSLVYTEVQVYRDGRWQLLAWHTSTLR